MLLMLVFDLTSIFAILVLHFISFRKSQTTKSDMPNAGHFKKESGLPNVEDVHLDSDFAN